MILFARTRNTCNSVYHNVTKNIIRNNKNNSKWYSTSASVSNGTVIIDKLEPIISSVKQQRGQQHTTLNCGKNNEHIMNIRRQSMTFYHNHEHPYQYLNDRIVSKAKRSFTTKDTNTGSDHHHQFHQQILELEDERNTLFGSSSSSSTPTPTSGNADNENEIELTIEEMNTEREALYNFSNEEKEAWGNIYAETNNDNPNTTTVNVSHATSKTIHTHSPAFMEAIQKARESKAIYEIELEKEKEKKMDNILQDWRDSKETIPNDNSITDTTSTSAMVEENNPIFTHLNHSGEEVSMVDIGEKKITQRTAIAQSSVIFPPEVMEAFVSSQNTTTEMIGPKGPIFATARLAGIMGAKRTSDLIPLCHPLPLSKVNIDINLIDNRVIIQCECRVTHKTGVEMEALTGASIAALTIYDMVKAVSHNVRIESTFLLGKSGGKRNVKEGKSL